jgi:hypothetical protein
MSNADTSPLVYKPENAKPIAAFGTAVFLMIMVRGEHKDIMLTDAGYYSPGYYYILDGSLVGTVLETNEVIYRPSGWLNSTHIGNSATPNMTLRCTPENDSMTWLCIAKKFNNNELPNVTDVTLTDGSTATLPDGTNLLLCTGVLSIAGKTFVGPRQIRIRTGDTIITSVGKSCSLIFNASVI